MIECGHKKVRGSRSSGSWKSPVNWVEAYLKKLHAVIALVLLGKAFGVVGFKTLPLNLFPDSNYPQVSIHLTWPGAAAENMADKVSRKVEKEMATLDQFWTVKATIRDETAAVRVEFEYVKSLDAAVADVNAARVSRTWRCSEGILRKSVWLSAGTVWPSTDFPRIRSRRQNCPFRWSREAATFSVREMPRSLPKKEIF